MTKGMGRTGLCVLGVAAAIALAACGDDESSDTSTTSSEASTSSTSSEALTKEEFVAQANAICAQGNKEIDAAANDVFSSGKPSPAEMEDFVTQDLLPSVEDQVQQISELPPPEGDEEQVQEILDAAEQGIEEGKSDPQSFQKADPFAEANQLAVAYGMKECGG